jgi:hypothetical protein
MPEARGLYATLAGVSNPAPRYFGIRALPLYCRPLGFFH